MATLDKIMLTLDKIMLTYTLGEYDPGSAQVWRMSSDLWRPGSSVL